jgi:hypothetical protein
LRSGIDTKFKLGFLAIVCRQLLHQESTESRASSTTERVEDEEALETGTVISEFIQLVHNGVDELLSNGVVATGI